MLKNSPGFLRQVLSLLDLFRHAPILRCPARPGFPGGLCGRLEFFCVSQTGSSSASSNFGGRKWKTEPWWITISIRLCLEAWRGAEGGGVGVKFMKMYLMRINLH